MDILYGIVGDGMGHAMRSAVIIENLISKGHNVHIVAYGDPVDFLEEKFPNVTEIWGMTMETRDNQFSIASTLLENIRTGATGVTGNAQKFYELANQFNPDVVFSDFELWSWLFAKWHNAPVINVANHYLLTRYEHPESIWKNRKQVATTAKTFIRVRVPNGDHYVVPSFVDMEPSKPNTTTVPPLLRDEILEANPEHGQHLLVYQTSYSDYDFTSQLKELDHPVRVYGLRRGLDSEVTEGNLTFCPVGEEQFLEDLRTCKAVVASPGFKLMSEAFHLGKPYFAIPIKDQFELTFNSRYLEELNYGTYSHYPDNEELTAFLKRVPEYRKSLEDYPRRDNSKTFYVIDRLLDKLGPGQQFKAAE